MKGSQGAICVDPAPFAGGQQQCMERSSPFSPQERGHSLLLLQIRTELEGKWRPDKFAILRKWMNASPKRWFCQKEDAFDYAMRPGIIIRNVKKRNGSKRVRKKKAGILSKSRTASMERFSEHAAPNQNEKLIDCRSDLEVPSEKNQKRVRRFLLEEEVMVLQKQLQKEVDLHLALENAINLSSGARPKHPQDIPTAARELLDDIAALEIVVAALEEESIALQGKIGHERKERESLEKIGAQSHGQDSPGSPKDIHVTQPSRQVPSSRRTKTPPKVHQSPERVVAAKTVTLEDHLLRSPIYRAAELSTAQENRLALASRGEMGILTGSPWSKSQPSETPRLVSLSWKGRASDSSSSQDSLSSTLSSDCSSTHSFLSGLDSQNHGHFSPARQAESAAIPTRLTPARISFSGASSSDQSGSSAPSCGREQDTCASPLVSEIFPIPTSPCTPEHRVRPTSPAGGSAEMLRFRNDDGALSSQDIPFSQLSRHRDEKYSLSVRSGFGTEEFFTPKTSISSFGDPVGDSLPSSAEKARSKVRVKLNLQPQETQTNVKESRKEASPDKKSYDPEFVTHRRLMFDILDSRVRLDILPPSSRNGPENYKSRECSKSANLLSEEMMKCMIGIYWHLAEPSMVPREQSAVDSPTSHFGHTALSTPSSYSSFSDHSLMNFVRSPLVDLRSKDDILGCESSPDPYRTRGRIPWADVGVYGRVLEVPWMSVRTDQLGYATHALNKFRFFAEQLSEVDPASMTHSQKLAFWLNLYNSLMMHAFLTHGIPRNDLKFFALLQKAAFNVGGHSFNAATIELSLLKAKTPSFRPQMGLLMALHRNKFSLSHEQSKFAIDYPEPQMIFSLCCGARSSPAVRVYTAAKVHKEINMALRDYARASVGLNGKGKLLVPKLLYTYAHDFVDDGSILDWVCQFLPSNQAGLVRECWQHRQNRLLGTKSFAILPFELNFRYLFAPMFDHCGDKY